MQRPLITGYSLRELTLEEFYALYNERESRYFTSSTREDIDAGVTEEERARISSRRSAFPTAERFQWGICFGEEVVGWTFAQQSDHDTLLMRNTAIDPAHRGKGLYTALLPIVIEHARSEGYQRIQSTHLAANNAVIVPKLKAGFIITGLNVNEKFGLLVTLTYFLTQGRHHLALNRIGFRD